jgi:hypothetical protein
MRVRFATVPSMLPPDSRLRREPLDRLIGEVHLACSVGAKGCDTVQHHTAEKEIRQTARKCVQDLREADKPHGALFSIATSEH